MQLFREANEFWKRHLENQDGRTQYDINTAPIEEIKVEPLYEDKKMGYLVENVKHVTEDVIFVGEPFTVVDDITKSEHAKATIRDEDFIEDDIEQETLELNETTNNKKLIQEFPCGKCGKGMYAIHVTEIR